MLPADLPYVPSDGSVPSSSADRSRAGRPAGGAPGIHVDVVEVGPAPNGRRVRAVVRLGGLSPADVRVELLRAGATAGGSSRAQVRRMWSTQSYANGSFVFEALLPGDGRPADGWQVRVRPADAPYPSPARRPLADARPEPHAAPPAPAADDAGSA